MNLFLCLETGLREIFAHKFRSLLSMMGIMFGVSALIATMALTAGIERGTRTFMEQIGGLELVNVVNKEISGQMFDFWNLSPGRTLQDARAIMASAPLVSHVSPEMSYGTQVSSGMESDRKQVTGVWPDSYIVGRHEMAMGRFITTIDVDRASHVVVIGDAVAKELWPRLQSSEVLGKILTVDNVPFRVVGVLKRYEREQDVQMRKIQQKRGTQIFGSSNNRRWDPFRRKNESVLIPLSTMFHEFKSGLFPMDSMESVRLENLSLRVSDLKYFRETLDQIRAALMKTHRGVDDFDLETREEWFDRMEASMSATRMSGGLIAAISLVVGAIGITNIMLASITERVREIGIRMAVGARGRDIFLQIIVESISIAFIGGMLGIACGAGLIQLLINLAPSENVPVLTWSSIVLSLAFAIVSGIVSGIYPALRASRLDPIGALRYE